MIAWLWDAPGAAYSACGITADPAAARRAAEALLRSGRADTARVEQARVVLAIATLTSFYQPTGHGWHAGPGSCAAIIWRPLPLPPREVSGAGLPRVR